MNADKIKLEQAKNKIIDYLKESKIDYKEIPEDKRGNTPFMITIGNQNQTLVYLSARHPNRISLKQTIKLGDEHRELTKNLGSLDWNKFVIEIQDKSLTYGLEYGFDIAKDEPHQINFVNLYSFVYTEDLTRDRFYHELVRIEQAKDALFNRISARLGLTISAPQPKEPDEVTSPYG